MVPKTERFEMRLDEETLRRVDEWRSSQTDVPSRSEAVRRLIDLGLTRGDKDSVHFSDGEKLLLLGMRDLYKALEIKTNDSIDVDFVSEVIYGGHYWAPRWELTGVFHDHVDSPANLSFVVDVLDMWEFLERGHAALSKQGKELVSQKAEPFGKSVTFPGFDGNNESELLGIAGFLIKKMDRFTRFAKRDLNSHFPTRETYTRMLRVFESMRSRLDGRDLNAQEIAQVLAAKRHPE
jgi:uncharacterized protein